MVFYSLMAKSREKYRKVNSNLNHAKPRGSALVFTLMILSILLVAGLGLASVVLIERKTSTITARSVMAFQAADSGVEMFALKIKGQTATSIATISSLLPSCNSETYHGEVSSGQSSYDVTFFNSTDNCETVTQLNCDAPINSVSCIKSIGSYRGATRAVQMGISLPAPSPAPTCWVSFRPNAIALGGSTYVEWYSENDADGRLPYSCTSFIPDNELPTPFGRSPSFSPPSTLTCTVTAENNSGDTYECNANVTVSPPGPPPLLVCPLGENYYYFCCLYSDPVNCFGCNLLLVNCDMACQSENCSGGTLVQEDPPICSCPDSQMNGSCGFSPGCVKNFICDCY